MNESRDFDIVVFGATGFTGVLTAEYLARHAPASLRWALAGRSPGKLEAVRTNLTGIDPRLEVMELLHADVADTASLDAVAARSRVVITTVGPYLQYGEPLVAACAANGTDYVDLTGEPEFVDRMYLLHHATAEATGSRLVHACGFDSIPHDLGAMFAIEHLEPTGPVTMRGVVRASATPSGGTFHSLLGQFSRVRQSQRAFRDRIKAQPKMVERSSRAVSGRPHRDPDLGVWLLPLPTIDAQVVARSGAALASYGQEFRYSHYAGIKSLPVAAVGAASVAGLFSAAQVPPLRRGLLKLVPQGAGPDEARRDKSWFKVDFIAESDGRKVHTQVSGGDPGYTETAKMLAESALCLAYDENPKVAGQVTTAEAMGENLTARLISAGLKFELLSKGIS
jgi:saccharopine dehydrogenase (NAD+, L-glutamate forming)